MKEPIIYVAKRGKDEIQIFQSYSNKLGYKNYIIRCEEGDYWSTGDCETYDWIDWGWELKEATENEQAYFLSCQHHNPPLKDGLIKKEVIKLYPIF